MSDFDFEPIRGLPARLPAGEKLIWQGAPKWWPFALRAFHVRKIAVYFAILAAWRVTSMLRDGQSAEAAAVAFLGLLLLAVCASGLLADHRLQHH